MHFEFDCSNNNSILIYRNCVRFKPLCKSVKVSMTAPWTKTTLPTILSKYELKDIFNADEFGLFYQCLPDKTFNLGSEMCSGGKKSKIRLTGMAANALGEKLEMFVIGKTSSPRCFKYIKSLPCRRYRNQKKSCMTGELFEEWVKGLDRGFRVKDKKMRFWSTIVQPTLLLKV